MRRPEWTERLKGAGDHQGRWALGLESMGFRITRQLLPPITNTTGRARYYSFFCWVYWTFARHMRQLGRDEAQYQEQKSWRMRLENALRTATSLDPNYSHGLVGYNSRIPLDGGQLYPIGRDVTITAWQAEYYKPSWLSLGFGRLKGDIVVVDPERGVPLAQAFDRRIRAADHGGAFYPELVSTSQEVRAAVISTLSHALALRALEDEDEEERTLLVGRLFNLARSSDPDPLTRTDWARSLSLTLLLDLIAAAGGEFLGVQTAHHVFGTGRFPGNGVYTPPEVLWKTFAQWERYQERQQEKLALYAYWHEVLLAIRAAEGAAIPTEDILNWILDRTQAAEAVRTRLGPDAVNSSVGECITRLQSSLENDGGIEQLIQTLTDAILDHSKPNKAGEATLVLLLLGYKWSEIGPSLPDAVASVHTGGAASELPVSTVSSAILKREQAPLHRLVRYVLENWVLAQSLRVALEKWSRNQDRFFIAREEEGYRIVRGQNPGAYLSYDAPRIDSSLQILEDLRLVAREGDRMTLTQEGERLRSQALAFHEDRLAQEG